MRFQGFLMAAATSRFVSARFPPRYPHPKSATWHMAPRTHRILHTVPCETSSRFDAGSYPSLARVSVLRIFLLSVYHHHYGLFIMAIFLSCCSPACLYCELLARF